MQRSRLKVLWTDTLSIVVSAAFLLLAFPQFEVPYLAWIALVPLLVLIRRAGPLRATLSSLATGFLFYSALMWWSLRLGGVNLFNFSLVNLWTASFFGIFGLCAYFFQKRLPVWNVLTLPSIWVTLEYVRCHLDFLSVPWGILGYSQYSVLPVAGMAALTGVYGVSFLIVAINAILLEIILHYLPLFKTGSLLRGPLQANLKISVCVFGGALIVLLASFLNELSHAHADAPSSSLTVAVIQGNVYSTEKTDEKLIERVVGKYHDLTLSIADSRPDFIAWPSSSVPGRIPFDTKLVSLLSDTAQKAGAFLLVGTSRFDKFNAAQKKQKRVSNSAFLFSPKGQILGKYDKIRLLPFDQYLPLRDYIRWPSWIVSSSITDHEPGRELTVFPMGNIKFGVQICWENMFSDQFRKMAGKGIDFMVSMTNEGFTDSPVAHHQLLAMNVFRAIENNIPIIRPAATGVSCIIEPNGRIIARVCNSLKNDVNIEGYQTARISLSGERTFYTRFGDLFVYIVSAFLLLLLIKIRYAAKIQPQEKF